MIKHFLILILITSHFLFPQDLDSLSNIDDSTKINIKSDSLIVSNDTSKVALKDSLSAPETIIPIQTQPLTETSFIISRKDFLFNDYRYTGDLLKLFPLTFTQDLGFVGYPNQSFIYGIGDGGISYMIDGVLWNDRYSNSLDLNLIQSEDIDSIEIVPLTRGFLYGPFNNAVTVNFITRDFVSQPPYSRIKYYEGPDGEAMIDGKFNAQVMKRLNLSFEVTNRGKDSTYTNTEFSIWQVNAKLKYFLSNDLNFAVDYRFNHLKRGLNGGVNIDSAAQISSDVNSILYDPLQAPVNNTIRKEEVIQNNFRLKILEKPNDNGLFSVKFHFRDNQISSKNNYSFSYSKIINKNYGINLNYIQKIGIFSGQVISSFDKNNINITYNSNSYGPEKIDFDYLSVAGIISADFLDGKLKPSVYYKYFRQNYSQYGNDFVDAKTGFGFDAMYYPLSNLYIFLGYSIYSQFDTDSCKTFECGISYDNQNLETDFRFFRKSNLIHYSVVLPIWTGIDIGFPNSSFDGIAAKLSYKFWKLFVETSVSHYFETDEFFRLPEVQFAVGIYLRDFFFNDNLNLKTGFKFHYTGKSEIYPLTIDPSNKLDFNLIGEIKERAIVYFIWENLFNNQYYITPYYPMPERNIRFGIAWELFN